MASKGKKRKLEESKAHVRGSKEHITACLKGLLAAASQDPSDWCHIGEENDKKGIDVYTPAAARELYPLPDDIPMDAMDLAVKVLKNAQSTATKGLNVVFLLKTGEVVMHGNKIIGVTGLWTRWMDNERLQICRSGKDDKAPTVVVTTVKMGDAPTIGMVHPN